ncbi:hypothetical protein BpHYR1_016442 [Brachionus plicatilis]|uniref:Uncharacterized protein n=1 Tax=Brachionus plicatilis TaxID=10195 RepID=A0A3M7PNJ4_BRAPC|nr:hypothetical protein BpHYR1_016442 [Brachionus plicatilis]
MLAHGDVVTILPVKLSSIEARLSRCWPVEFKLYDVVASDRLFIQWWANLNYGYSVWIGDQHLVEQTAWLTVLDKAGVTKCVGDVCISEVCIG